MLDRVLGAENFIADVVWEGGRKNDAQFLSPSTDYMLIYAKNVAALGQAKWREPKAGVDAIVEAGRKAWERSGSDEVAATRVFREWWTKLPQDDPRQRQPTITMATSLLGWVPTIALNEGLQRTIAFFEERLLDIAAAPDRFEMPTLPRQAV